MRAPQSGRRLHSPLGNWIAQLKRRQLFPLAEVDSMANIISEFTKFIQRGNVIDLAVGIIIGAAFGKVVSALVDVVLMPPIGALINNVNFSYLKFTIPDTTATIRYGLFVQ